MITADAMRTQAATAVWTDFPAAAQVLQVRRTRTIKDPRSKGGNGSGSARKTTVEVVYLTCSLPADQAQPQALADRVQGHRGTENRLHRIQDATLDEDRHQPRTAGGPQVMATLRSAATSLIRLTHGPTSPIATTRSLAGHPGQASRLLTQPPT